MIETCETRFEVGNVGDETTCYDFMRDAIRDLIASAKKQGWCEVEVALTLADAADDHVVALADHISRIRRSN